MEVQVAEGKLTGGSKSRTVGSLLDSYVDHLEHKGLSPKTTHNYRRYIENTLRPALGGKAVHGLTAWDLDALYAEMTDAGRAAATVRLAHAIIAGALAQAVRWGWISVNVAKMASPPTVHQKRITPPTVEEVRKLINAAEGRNPVLAALIMLAALTGARRGELCALRWTDVDLDAGTVRIARSMLDLPGRVEEKATKTHQERVLALGQAGRELLKLHRDQVLSWAQAGEVFLAANAYVFSGRLDGATPIRPDSVTGFFRRVRDELGMTHVHLHSLRHFVATQLAARGDVSARTLAGRLGHADASVTMRVYAAFFPAADLEAADHVGRLLQGGTGG
jgi:integrase